MENNNIKVERIRSICTIRISISKQELERLKGEPNAFLRSSNVKGQIEAYENILKIIKS